MKAFCVSSLSREIANAIMLKLGNFSQEKEHLLRILPCVSVGLQENYKSNEISICNRSLTSKCQLLKIGNWTTCKRLNIKYINQMRKFYLQMI